MQVLDGPRFLWRGVLLDVGRHFFSVEFIKKVLDVMALYKMNRFHWHLTEDQVSGSLVRAQWFVTDVARHLQHAPDCCMWTVLLEFF